MKLKGILNKTLLIAVVLFVVALVPRVYNLTGHSLLADELTWMVESKELFLAIRAGKMSFFDTGWWTVKDDVRAISLPNTFLSGMVYYFFVPGQSNHSLGIFNEIFAVRLPGVLISAMFIPAFYILSKKFVRNKIALLAAVFLALDPVAIGTARYLNQDSTLMIFSFLSLGIYLYKSNKFCLTLSALFAALAFLTKPQGLLIDVVIFLISLPLLLNLKKNIKSVMRPLIWITLSFGFIYILFPYLWHDPINRLVGYLANNLQVSSSQGREVIFLGQVTTNPAWYYYLVTVPFHTLEPVLVGLVIALVLLVRRPFKKYSLFVIAGLIYCGLYFVAISTSSIKLGTRYFFPIWPYLTLLSTWGLVYFEEHFVQNKALKKLFFGVLIAIPLFWLVRFFPNFYLFYNSLTTAKAYQNRETIGFCDGIKPSINYLESNHKLFHGVKLEIKYCYPTAQYFTGFTLNKAYDLSDQPDFIIIENSGSQTSPEIEREIAKSSYKLIKEIKFNGIELTRIYSND